MTHIFTLANRSYYKFSLELSAVRKPHILNFEQLYFFKFFTKENRIVFFQIENICK